MKNLLRFIPLFFLGCLVGCSGNIPVSGRVVFSDDESPVPVGYICFDSGRSVSRGQIKPDGTYVMGTAKTADGVPPGQYDVYFISTEAVVGESDNTGESGQGEPVYMSFLDEKYMSASQSGLTANIEGPTKNLEFKVDRNPKFPVDKMPK